jgi:CheY-like chemotaxis protein
MQLVEMMGGLIGFESDLGHGSTFWFELPLEMADIEAVTAEKSKSESLRKVVAYEDLPSLQGRVLLAEDNPANQLIGQTILERIGLHVGVAANGHEVIESLRSVPYDLILMDINMPEMDGIEATVAIRQLPGSLASTPIIAMTAQAMPGDRERFLSLGMDGYVSKPINRRELYECISGVLNSHDLPSVNTSDANSTEMPGTGMTIIDTNVLGNLKEDVGAELLPQIIDTFVSELSAHVEAITAAAKCGDCEVVTAQAHPLKSSSAYFGAVALAELANQLERAGRKCDLDAIRQGALHLPQISSQTKATLLIALSNLQSSAPESE